MSQDAVKGKNDTYPPKTEGNCLVALGSNLDSEAGDLTQTLDQAVQLMGESGLVIRSRSPNYRTPAYPAGAGPDFVNAAVLMRTPYDPAQTLARLHEIEAALGRTRTRRWGARTLDLDLIAFDDLVLPDAQTHQYWRELPLKAQKTTAPDVLIVPHPRLAERAFVLVPLLEIAPDWRHPVSGLSVRTMHDALPMAARDEVVAL